MFYAIRKDGVRVSAESAERNEGYYCPLCQGTVVARQGSVRMWHFSHLNKSDCDTDFKTPDMSEWHRMRQSLFQVQDQEVTVCNRMTGEKHRADVLVHNKYVIEFQHSKISTEEFDRRNEFYTRCGYKVVWVFDLSEVRDHLFIWQYTNTIRFSWNWAWHTWDNCNLSSGKVLILIETSMHSRDQLMTVPCWSRVVNGTQGTNNKHAQNFSVFWVHKNELVNYSCFCDTWELDTLTSCCPQCGRLYHKYKMKEKQEYYFKCYHGK